MQQFDPSPPLNPTTARYCEDGKRVPCSRPAGHWWPVQAEQGSCRYSTPPSARRTWSDHGGRQTAALPLDEQLASVGPTGLESTNVRELLEAVQVPRIPSGASLSETTYTRRPKAITRTAKAKAAQPLGP